MGTEKENKLWFEKDMEKVRILLNFLDRNCNSEKSKDPIRIGQ